jgi:hypothetical protein
LRHDDVRSYLYYFQILADSYVERMTNHYSANLQVMFKLHSVKSCIVNVYTINVVRVVLLHINGDYVAKSNRLLKLPRAKDQLDAGKMKGRLECISKVLQERAYSLRFY